jgi:hypothetical protein
MDSCYKTSDNKHFGCPPRMADGRHFTDYRPHCYVDNLIIAENGINNSFNYRNFLQQNATQLMNINRKYSCMKNCCGPCLPGNGTMLPEANKFICDKKSCRLVTNDSNGLGTGRVYSPEDASCASMGVCGNPVPNACMTPQDAFNYFPPQAAQQMGRITVPGGGLVGEGGDPTHYQ